MARLVLQLKKKKNYPIIIETGTNKLQQCFVSAHVCSDQNAKLRLSRMEGVEIKTSFRQTGHVSIMSLELKCSPTAALAALLLEEP